MGHSNVSAYLQFFRWLLFVSSTSARTYYPLSREHERPYLERSISSLSEATPALILVGQPSSVHSQKNVWEYGRQLNAGIWGHYRTSGALTSELGTSAISIFPHAMAQSTEHPLLCLRETLSAYPFCSYTNADLSAAHDSLVHRW